MKEITQNSKHFFAIDGLRGVAALLVVWQHVTESLVQLPSIAKNGTLLADLSKSFDFGRIGIICFFIISGYVIPSSLTGKSKQQAIKKFALRRVFRLYPAYWLSLLGIIIFYKMTHFRVETSTILANTTMLQSFFGKNHLIGLYWTLQVELIFYTLCAFLFYFARLNKPRFIMQIIWLLFIFFVIEQVIINYTTMLNWTKEFQFLPYLLALMFLGSLFRKLHDEPENTKIKYYVWVGTALCLGLPVFLLVSSALGFDLAANAFRFGIAHTSGFIIFFLGIKYLKNAPKFLLWLGTISYSLYLFHPLVLYTVKYGLQLKIANGINAYSLWVYLLFVSLCSILLASIVYRFVERPFIQYSKRLTQEK